MALSGQLINGRFGDLTFDHGGLPPLPPAGNDREWWDKGPNNNNFNRPWSAIYCAAWVSTIAGATLLIGATTAPTTETVQISASKRDFCRQVDKESSFAALQSILCGYKAEPKP